MWKVLNLALIHFLTGLFTDSHTFILARSLLTHSLTSQDNAPAPIVFTRLNSSVVTPPEAGNVIPPFSPAVKNYDIKSNVGKKIVHLVDNFSHWRQLMKVRIYLLTHSLSHSLTHSLTH